MNIPLVMTLVADLGFYLGVTNIKELPGCAHLTISPEWEVDINGHDRPETLPSGETIDPFSMYFRYQGWPAAMVNAAGGGIVAGLSANEASLIAALRAAIPSVESGRTL